MGDMVTGGLFCAGGLVLGAVNSGGNVTAILVYSVVSFLFGFVMALAIHGRGNAAGGRDHGHDG